MVWSLRRTLVVALLNVMMVTMAPADKLFITDIDDSAIYVGDNSGPDFFSSSFRRLSVTGVEDPVGIDYDYRNEMVYWTDESRRTISRAMLDGSQQETLVQEFQGVGYPEGLVLDLEEDRMIWTDTLLEKIESSNLDGSNRKTIINTGLYLPWSITLSQKRKMLYWTEHGDETSIRAKIEMSNKWGIGRRAIVTENIRQPNGIAVDSQEQRLYWTESYYDKLESIDLDTFSNRRLHVYASSGDPFLFGVSLYFNSIYFTEFASSILYETELGDSEIREVRVHSFPVHVKIYADLTCSDSSQCVGESTCQLIAYQTPGCTCLPGYTGSSCNQVITCPPPYDVDPETHYEDLRSTYYNDETLLEVCDNGNNRRTLFCNGYTGDWYTTTSLDCNNPQASGLSEAAIIAIACCASVVALLIAGFCYRSYNKSRRPVPPTTQNQGVTQRVPQPVPTVSNMASNAQFAQGGRNVTFLAGGAVGWTVASPPLTEKGHSSQAPTAGPTAEMPPPEYSTIIN